ncbi:hypothetical protein [Microbulbifer sp. GL-2]|uniref:c-type cytochrome n=1 Tax=Microbulbifer sp. GL-2 TaxID=2591606 RepID=UPI00116242B2|nr:hypothetical protein [Microbulbifer sp. GL-2]BBM01223.1 hypothetical protein GL2_12970 [Microbulbifer sp. GL-2]
MRYKWIWLCLCFLALSPEFLWAQLAPENDRLAARASNLLSYLAVDYGDAVDNGKVLDTELYRLQLQHAVQARQLVLQLPDRPGRASLQKGLGELGEAIERKEGGETVRRRANELADRMAALYQMQRSPAHTLPEASLAMPLYRQRCSSCHGGQGEGGEDVPDLRDTSRMASFSLYDLYNTLNPTVNGVHGENVDGNLTVWQRWALAVTVAAFSVNDQLPPSADLAEHYPALVGLPGMAVTRPVELPADASSALMWWRAHPHLVRALEPPLARADGLLQLAQTDYRAGDRAGAYHKLMLAYREGYLPLRAQIAMRDQVLTTQLQARWQQLRSELLSGAPNAEVIASFQDLRAMLVSAQARLGPTVGGGYEYLWAALLFALALALGVALWWALRRRKLSRL